MSNMYGKDKFHDRQKAVLQKSAQKIENDSGWSQDNFLREYKKPDTFDTPDTRRSVSEKITVIYYLCRKTCEQFDSVHRSLLFT